MSTVARRAALFVDDTSLALAWRSDNATTVRHAEANHTGEGSLASAIAPLLMQAGVIGELLVVIDRPLSHLRTIDLAPMARDVAERILARDWERYVVGRGRGAYVVAARALAGSRWTAAFVRADLLECIAEAARPHAAVVSFATSDDVLAASIARDEPVRGAGEHTIVVLRAREAPVQLVRLWRGLPVGGRRLLAGATTEDVASHARDHAMAGAHVITRDCGAQSPAVAMAALAIDAHPLLPLVSPGSRQVDVRASRTATWWTIAAAAAAVLLALPLEQAVVNAQLRRISDQRRAITPQVAHAMVQRDSLQSQSDILVSLADREQRASRDGGVVAAIALALPRDAALSMLQINGDSVAVEGDSRNGGAVYDALRKVNELEQVTLAAPLRRERGVIDSMGTVGHFAFAARIRAASR